MTSNVTMMDGEVAAEGGASAASLTSPCHYHVTGESVSTVWILQLQVELLQTVTRRLCLLQCCMLQAGPGQGCLTSTR